MPLASPHARYVPSNPPGWFHGEYTFWNLARELFGHAGRLNRSGAQHLLVGMGLLLIGVVVGTVEHGSPLGWAVGVAGGLAMWHGYRQQRQARERLSMAIGGVMLQCNNPAMALWADPVEKARLLDVVQQERRGSPPGSFDELMSAVAEASLSGRMVRAPVHWWYGQRFIGFVDGPSVGTVAGTTGTNPSTDESFRE